MQDSTPASDSRPFVALSDEELAQRAQAGAMASFVELVGRFEGRVYAFLLRRLGCGGATSDAEDLTQDTFLRAWQKIGHYQPGRRFSTWLFTIAGRAAIDHHRGRRRPIHVDDLEHR